jgi:hypothetical protein
VEELVNEDADVVTQNYWACCVKHGESIQDGVYIKEIGHDKILEPIIVDREQ